MSTTAEEIWELLGELIKAQKETDRLLREQSQETNRKFQETDRKFQELIFDNHHKIFNYETSWLV